MLHREILRAAANRGKPPDDAPEMLLAHVDGIRDGQVAGDAVSPVVLVTLLRCQPVVEGGQARALESCAREDPVAENQACGSRKSTQRMTCATSQHRIMSQSFIGSRLQNPDGNSFYYTSGAAESGQREYGILSIEINWKEVVWLAATHQ